jgi:polyribonucleotide nucleotidyltransferase
MKPKGDQYTAIVGDQPILFETGKLAGQAGGAVTARIGETLLFCSATMGEEPRTGINYFPLSVDYEERMYAGGRIPGSFFRREGRPTENAVLIARLTDRPMRPLFPEDLRNDVQIILYSLSADGENPLDILAINTASTALMISDIPWGGPVGAVRVGQIDGNLVLNPTYKEMEQSDLNLRVAGTRDAILMVECSANEVNEDIIANALEFAHDAIQPLIDIQEQMASEIGKPKRDYPSFVLSPELIDTINQRVAASIDAVLDQKHTKFERKQALDAIRDPLVEELAGEDEEAKKDVKEAFEVIHKKQVRNRIINHGIRPDGRRSTEIRPIWCEVEFSPRAHGSGIFTRGETQVLTLATLGTPRDAQSLDNLTPFEAKRYMHHYNFPPFSVGETRFLRGTSRRETGHGALAERALLPVIPSELDFPYTMRLVSECLSSNGSTSMASVCGSTLALMDSGVPISKPVSGIAMGLVNEDDKYTILSDIQGLEDHIGDMDFKVAGTRDGITALQMDIKIGGISPSLMAEALKQAKEGRAHILGKMLEVIPEPRSEVKQHAPHISVVTIPVDKIGLLIGPGGKTIRSIQEDTGAKIDIDEDGSVFIATTDRESDRLARERIEALTETPEVGRIYTGKVVRTADFGAFVEILPGTDGMVHISQLDSERIDKVEDIAVVGDEITVMVTNIDENGRVRLSRKAVLEGWTVKEAMSKDRGGGPRRNRGQRHQRSSGKRNPRQ